MKVMANCMKYKDNWQYELPADEWELFLNFSKLDSECNKMWNDYRRRLITYDELSRFEFNLYISFLRERKLNSLI